MSAKTFVPISWSAARIDRLTKLRAQGLPWKAAAESLGTTVKAAKSAWKRNGSPQVGEVVLHQAEPVTRLCLCGCGARFASAHLGERIRPECRSMWEQQV